MKKIILFVLLAITNDAMSFDVKPIFSVPFEKIGNYAVVDVKINNSSTLHLILDTGIRNTIITELSPDQEVQLTHYQERVLYGLGIGDSTLKAYYSENNTLRLGKVKLENSIVYILKNDYFNFSKFTGRRINGLIGNDVIQPYVTEINNSKKRIYFYRDDSLFSPPEGYQEIPLCVSENKFYTKLKVTDNDSLTKEVKMLVDTGAEINAWFKCFSGKSLNVPTNAIKAYIGQGLGGEITGMIGKIPILYFGKYPIAQPIVSFPDSICVSDVINNSDRDGTIGNQLLSRFDYILGFNQKHMYVKPNRAIRQPFTYNIAGIEVIQIIPFMPYIEVWKVWKGSPAEKAQILEGDQLIEVNNNKVSDLGIDEIKQFFQDSSNKSLIIKVLRNGVLMNKEISMKPRI